MSTVFYVTLIFAASAAIAYLVPMFFLAMAAIWDIRFEMENQTGSHALSIQGPVTSWKQTILLAIRQSVRWPLVYVQAQRKS